MGWLELFDLITEYGTTSTSIAESLLSGGPPTLLDYNGPPLDCSSNVSNNACNNKENVVVHSTKTPDPPGRTV
jgi:hypothetical protein